MNRLLPALVASLLASPVHAAESRGPKLEAQLAAGKAQAAWKGCEKMMEKGALQHDDEVEVCAEADLRQAEELNPGGLSLEQLNVHWARWNGTAAAAKTRARAAQLRLEAAGGDIDTIAAIWGAFSDTPAGQACSDLLYQHYVDQNSSAAMAEFVARFPDAPQIERAKAVADDLIWAEAEAVGTAQGWADFMRAHPTHPRLADAVRWFETLAFREAEELGTAQGWTDFLSKFPNHARYEEAEQNRITAMFDEAVEKGPEVMLAVADAWPDHPRSALARTQAYAQMLEVQLLSRGYHDPAWKPPSSLNEPPVAVPLGVDGLNVIYPPGQPTGMVSLVWVEGSQASSLTTVYAEHLAAQGFPSDRIEAITQVGWLPPQGQKLVGRLQAPLCQPDGIEGHFAVVTQAFGLELIFPFSVGVVCSQAKP
jgi:hypothetical protein